ncbi:MAG: dTMP kinase [Candidatus Omnitrophota bacterium]
MRKFIAIEGLDGAGKSTQVRLLKKYFDTRGIDYKYIHFPRTDLSSPIYGEMVSNFLKGNYGDVNTVNPYLVALLYAGDRDNAKTMIGEWLEKGNFVVLDRYVYSNMAYQGAKFNHSEDKEKIKKWISELEFGHNQIPKPTLSIFLHMQLEFVNHQLKTRTHCQNNEDIHENSLELQEKVEKEYLNLVEKNDDFKLIDCFNEMGSTLPPEKIHERIINLLVDEKILENF